MGEKCRDPALRTIAGSAGPKASTCRRPRSDTLGCVSAEALAPSPSSQGQVQTQPLVREALVGGVAAERELCRRLLPAVRAFAQRRLRPSSVDDFTHDVLVHLVEALRSGRIEEPERIASFALGICRNLARERARSNERRNLLASQYGVTESDLVAWDREHEVRRDHLEDCYSQLAERARSVLRATFCDDHPDSEIAARLSLTEANVRIIRHRSLAMLRGCLEKPISWVQT